MNKGKPTRNLPLELFEELGTLLFDNSGMCINGITNLPIADIYVRHR